MTEEWRPVSGFPNYAVSTFGRVARTGHTGRYRPSNRLLKLTPGPSGYVIVSLYRGDGLHYPKGVHAIVCETFLGPRPSLDHQAAHWDGVRVNNRLENLRWATRAENMSDCVRHGTRPMGDRHHARANPACLARGERNGGGGKLKASDIASIRADTRFHREIAADYGVVKSMIAMIKRREAWRHIPEEQAA